MRWSELFVAEAEDLGEHYPNRSEKTADGVVHGVGLLAAAIGAGVLFTYALSKGGAPLASATALYAFCLIVMLACSAAYNLTRPSRARRVLRRLDEASIFIMIAGSCTPFTSQLPPPALGFWMTAAVWTAALGLGFGKITLPRISDRAWSATYVAFGWLAAMTLAPVMHGLPMVAIALLATGGLIYSGGVLIYLNHGLPFRRAIWHAIVVVAAAVHYGAVFAGLVLT
jgi:hemolysin III